MFDLIKKRLRFYKLEIQAAKYTDCYGKILNNNPKYLQQMKTGKYNTPSKNLINAVHSMSSDGGTIENTANFEYEFNEPGFPVKITIAGEDLNGDGISNSMTWQHTCTCIIAVKDFIKTAEISLWNI